MEVETFVADGAIQGARIMVTFWHLPPLFFQSDFDENEGSGPFLSIAHRLYSCEYSHVSPFLHKPLSQCLHTTLPYDPYGCGAICLSGHLFPWGQSPSRKALQCGRFGSRPNLCSFLRKSANEKSVKDGRRSSTEVSMVDFLLKRSRTLTYVQVYNSNTRDIENT